MTELHRPLIAFPFHDWRKSLAEGFRTRDGHILTEIHRSRSISPLIVVNRPRSRIERLLRDTPPLPGRVLFSMRLAGQELVAIELKPGLIVLDTSTPDVLSPAALRRAWWFAVFERPAVTELIRRSVERLNATHAAAIAWVPTVAPVVQTLEPSAFVFDSLDNWLIHPVLRRHATLAKAGYARLLPQATAVVASAPLSAGVLKQWRSDVKVIPNGVDPQHFARRRPRPSDLPPAPVVGYAGKLAHRINAELVVEVSSRMPECAFVFVGPVLEPRAVRGLRRPSNVHLLGDRHYDELPGYVRHFDVAWIPHRVGEGETGGDPIKLYEYLAAGRPVVSTRIDGMDRWDKGVALIDTAAQAELAIRSQLVSPRVPPVPGDRHWSAIAGRLVDMVYPEAVKDAAPTSQAP